MKGMQEKGITLIALVITIIVLLILAGVSINMVLGNNGILSKATEAVEANRVATLTEQIEMWNADKEMEKYTTNSSTQSLEEFVVGLQTSGLISEEEKSKILTTGKITIENTDFIFKTDTYYISNKKELEAFRDNVDNGYSYKNETVVLTNDIDLGGTKEDVSTWWNPIGGNGKRFEGTFDGNNKEITNMYLEEYETGEFIALFSDINNATIKNLTVSGELIAGPYVSEQINPSAGGIIGVARGNCEIINCINKTNIFKQSANREIGGFIGCILGTGNVTISNCVNLGNIKGANAAGGLVGTVDSSLIINNSHNEGEIGVAISQFVGGLVARSGDNAKFVKIENSYNKGYLKSKGYAAGIMALMNHGETIINNTYNEGIIEVVDRTIVAYVGGIVGRAIYTAGEVTISNSYNVKDINTLKENKSVILGGILGENNAKVANIINCYNLGDLEGDYTSGICGLVSGSASTILDPTLNIINSYNKGSVIGRTHTTGITRLHSSTGNVNVQNAYYLDTCATIGVENTETDDATPLTETYMKSQDFVDDLNNNLSSIQTDIELNEWKYVENDYPIFE